MTDKTATYSKIASAIYLITGFFTDQEPLKWRLRGLAGDLVSENYKDKSSLSRELSNLFGVARSAGLVSDTNCDILLRELARISEETGHPIAFLTEPMAQVEAPVARAIAPVEEQRPAPRTTPEYLPAIKDKIYERKPEERHALKEFGAVSVKKNSRQSIIIALLKRKKEIMIKDVSPLITGCSEKTIQRELSQMVESGILKKMGDKRWTHYTLA